VRRRGKPLLGICLGMQLLATRGTEHGEHRGLGWVPGAATLIPTRPDDPSIRVPHIGWNDVRFLKTGGVHRDQGPSKSFYFVHSYRLEPEDPGVIAGVCDHGGEFAATIEMSNIVAAQFHPEKSHHAGLALLRNFLTMGG
jgi:glutamine amidotransferase